MRFLPLPLLFTAFTISLNAQTTMFPEWTAPVFQNGQALPHPFAGGLNAPQFSAADLNNDGLDDIVVFERAGDKVLTFLRSSVTNDLVYAPEYACLFPKLNDWALLRDYNQDGAPDIFCASTQQGSQEIQVFRGFYENDALHFEPFLFTYPGCTNCDERYIWYPDEDQPGFYNNMQIAKSDVPAVDDIDNDGDLDIVGFEAGLSTNMWWVRNMSVEQGFGLDSLKFRVLDKCWGRFYENGLEPCRAKLSTNSTECAPPFAPPGPPVEDRDDFRHPGASVLTVDLDVDGDREVVLGNISFSCLGMMTNGGTPTQAWMTAQDTTFPVYNEPVDLTLFPAAFYVDADFDGKKDLLVAPNNKTIGEDRSNVWFYKNTATSGHNFDLVEKRWLVGDLIDLGTASHPAFTDVNGDGLTDIVVGNYGFYTLGISTNARLALFLNTGSATAPAFTLVDTDWLGMSEFAPNDYDFTPTFGDLDNDNDLDLLVGSNYGALYYYRNSAGAGNPMLLTRDQNPLWLSIDVGLASAPFVIDLDEDGLADILMGERNGNINFFKNTGTLGSPNFATTPTVQKLGDIDLRLPGEAVGFSMPVVVPTIDGGRMIVCGAQGGQLEAYTVGAPTAEPWTAVSLTWGNTDDGNRSSPAIADLDADGILDMVCGNLRGGLHLYRTELADCSPTSVFTPNTQRLPVRLYPNPVADVLRVESDATGAVSWSVVNTLGQVVAQSTAPSGTFSIDVQKLKPGVYILEVRSGGITGTQRVVKK